MMLTQCYFYWYDSEHKPTWMKIFQFTEIKIHNSENKNWKITYYETMYEHLLSYA